MQETVINLIFFILIAFNRRGCLEDKEKIY